MKRVMLTGISGVGKSTLVAELVRRDYKAVDADTAEYSEWVEVSGEDTAAGTPVEAGRDWVWREDRIAQLLATEDAPVLFLSGCAANMKKFLPQFDTVILLSASVPVLVERLAHRTTNDYGKRPEEAERVLSLKQAVEPLLRKAAGYEIDTGGSLDETIAAVLRLAV